MALSNKFGWLILTTGNKSETSTGFCTLYGDTAGGFAVLRHFKNNRLRSGRPFEPQGRDTISHEHNNIGVIL